MELHVWGPAFGLPSIDAECIAAIVYLNQLLPKEAWKLVVAHDPSTSPNGDFPCLIDGDHQWSGFSAIVDWLKSNGLTLDAHLSGKQRADATALKSHLLTNALPLIDAHLYILSSNYINTVRPAWNHILPSPFRQTVLSRRYQIAKARTATFGLSSSSADDLSVSEFTPQQEQEANMISSRPSLLFRRRQTVLATLKKEQIDMKFKLGGMADVLMEPLHAFLAGKSYLVSDKAGPTSIDCLCFGYLALLLHANCECNWIAEIVRKTYPTITKYTTALKMELLGIQRFNVDAIKAAPLTSVATSPRIEGLPYRIAETSTTQSMISQFGRSALLRFFTPSQLHILLPTQSFACINEPRSSLTRSWLSPLSILLALAGPALAATAWVFYSTTHAEMEPDKRFGRAVPRIQGFGAAGAILSGLSMPRQSSRYPGRSNTSQHPFDGQAREMREQDRTEIRPSGINEVKIEVSPS